MDNQEETDKFLETYNIPRLIKEEKENMNGQIASNKTEFEKNQTQVWFLVRELRYHMLQGLQCRRPGFDPWVRKIPWRRKWQSTPAFLPGEAHGQRSLAGYHPWGHKQLDMTKWLTHTQAAGQLLSPCAPEPAHGQLERPHTTKDLVSQGNQINK